MQKLTLKIENLYESKTVEVTDELTIGRSSAQAQLVLDDLGISGVNTTFFRDGESFLVVDENSTNGTFLNGEKLSGAPKKLLDGDEIKIGTNTRIRVIIGEQSAAVSSEQPAEISTASTAAAAGQRPTKKKSNPKSKNQNPKSNKPPFAVIAAVASSFLIVFFAVIAVLIASSIGPDRNGGKGSPTPLINTQLAVPIRVIDPLGGEDPDDLDDLIASWEVEEEELKIDEVADVKVTAEDATNEEIELTVTAAFLAEQKAKAFEPRAKPTGIRPPGLNVPKELFGDGVIKQKAKLAQMKATGYQQPMDFSDLAQKRLTRELIEMPMATKSFYLEVGGSAQDRTFQAFSFQTGLAEILPGSPKYQPLAQLAANFAGQQYNLNDAGHRKQIRMRLLRMFNQRAKPILEELANAYYQKFNRPLRVTSLTRSMDYQILLNANNANSFKVRGEGSLPPHTSGCAFDLARKHMDFEEQNFVMEKLAQMERDKKLDALIEYGANACFHVFIYHDGNAPN